MTISLAINSGLKGWHLLVKIDSQLMLC